jgi:hypothetical protein
MDNILSFEKQVNDFSIDVIDEADKAIKGTAIQLFRDIIIASPVDEGRFRSNWFVRKDAPSTKSNPNAIKSEQEIIKRTSDKISSYESYNSITLTNNLPYSQVIEFGGYKTGSASSPDSKVTAQGYSKQAPKGVVRVNVLRFRKIFEEQAKKNGFQ